jgi:hypothetical protein
MSLGKTRGNAWCSQLLAISPTGCLVTREMSGKNSAGRALMASAAAKTARFPVHSLGGEDHRVTAGGLDRVLRFGLPHDVRETGNGSFSLPQPSRNDSGDQKSYWTLNFQKRPSCTCVGCSQGVAVTASGAE